MLNLSQSPLLQSPLKLSGGCNSKFKNTVSPTLFVGSCTKQFKKKATNVYMTMI